MDAGNDLQNSINKDIKIVHQIKYTREYFLVQFLQGQGGNILDFFSFRIVITKITHPPEN